MSSSKVDCEEEHCTAASAVAISVREKPMPPSSYYALRFPISMLDSPHISQQRQHCGLGKNRKAHREDCDPCVKFVGLDDAVREQYIADSCPLNVNALLLSCPL